MSQSNTASAKLEVLKTQKSVELSLNDLRIIVGCFKALAWQSEQDGEDYLDPDAKALHVKLESLYLASLDQAADGNGRGNSRNAGSGSGNAKGNGYRNGAGKRTGR